ncbi:MAG: LLM class flavin-dependent oxidoreductase [Anaerolineae bacterium]|nr:LLM class flavin-dependent oxidoreductase [Anaerolineae bacterium]
MNDTTREFEIGVMFKCHNPPEDLRDFCQRAERGGFDELWLVEDCFFGGGISSVATALAVTETITVGLGIMPAVARNPAFAAMEIATLLRLHPGRLLPGFGHGVGEWMRQIGAFPKSQLAALGEVTQVVRALLRGENVTLHGRHVNLDAVQLEFPPIGDVPPIQLGVRGPKSLALSGRVADGTILAEGSSPSYIQWAREQIAGGQREAGRADEAHRVTVFVPCAVDADAQAARDRLRPLIAQILAPERFHQQLEPLGIVPRLREILAAGGVDLLAREMPDEWLHEFSVVGAPEDCAASVRRFATAGADSVVLVQLVDDAGMLDAVVETVLPLV